MDIISGIYIIRCLVDFKCYIGSAVDLKRRKKVHFSNLRLGKHNNPHLQNAYNKYGKNNFIFGIIEIIEYKENLISKEDYYIKLFKSNDMNFGYNIRKNASSNLGFHHSQEIKDQISKNADPRNGELNPMFGKHHTDDVRKRISEKMKIVNLGENNPMYGRKRSEESILKMKKTIKEKKDLKNSELNKITKEENGI